MANFFDTIPAEDTQPTDADPRNFFADIPAEQAQDNPPPDLLAPDSARKVQAINPNVVGFGGNLAQPSGPAKDILSSPMAYVQEPFNMAGRVLNAGVSDVANAAASLNGVPNAAGWGENTKELLTRPEPLYDPKPLPQQMTLAEISKSNPVAATAGKVAGGLVSSAPMLAAMPQGALGKLIAAGFTADMFKNAVNASGRLGSEMGKPEEDRNHDEITSALSEIIQGAAFSGLGGAHLGGEGLGTLASKLKAEPMAPEARQQWAKTKLSDPQLKELVKRGNMVNELESTPLDPATGNPISNAKSTLEKDDARIAQLNAEKERTQNAVNQPTATQVGIRSEGSPVGKSSPHGQQGETPVVPPQRGTPDAPVAEPKPVEAQKVEATIAPDVQQFIKDYQDPSKKISNISSDPSAMTTRKAGMAVKSLDDLNALIALDRKNKAELSGAMARMKAGTMPTPAEQRLLSTTQYPREVIETATDSGSAREELRVESNGAKRLGERPLDWKKNPEVEAWLRKNGKELGIELPAKESPAPAAETKAKEPWEMTREEFIKAGPDGYKDDHMTGWSKTGGDHAASVAAAIDNGRPVPPEVLADYPDLKPSAKAAETKNASETITGSNEGKASEMPADTGATPQPGQSSSTEKPITHDLGNGYTAKIYTQTGKITLRDKDDNYVGNVKTEEISPDTLGIALSFIEDAHRGNGLVQKSLELLSKETGKNLVSDQYPSPSASKMWERMGAKRVKIEIGEVGEGDIQSRYLLKNKESTSTAKPSEAANAEQSISEKPVEVKPQENLAKDWTSATEDSVESPAIEPPNTINPETGLVEYHAGIPIPKFENRKMSEIDRVTGNRSAKLQKSFNEAQRAQREINKVIPNRKRQEAASVYREAGGDMAKLKEWEANAKQDWMRRMAKDAQTLTPEEIAVVNKVASAFDVLGKRGEKNDVLKTFRENYITHVWDVTKPGQKFGFGSSALKAKFKFSKARSFDTFFDGDQAGFKPKSTAIGDLLPAYMEEMNRTIADRQAVQELVKGKSKDGEPLAVPRGNAKVIEGDGGKAVLVAPKALKDVDTSHYKVMENQPALADWTWAGKDTDGKPIFMKSDLAVHPDVYRRLNSILGTSALKQWYRDVTPGIAQVPKAILKGIDMAQGAMKREMFGFLAPFHQVQEGTHAVGHKVNPFFGIPKIDLRDAGQFDAAKHGLMLLPDKTVGSHYLEGVGSNSSLISQGLRKTGKAGKVVADVIDGYQDYLFHQYIPGLKYKTYEAILERNTKRYQPELAKGELTPSDIKTLSAEQSNAAYGHLNYAMLDRNPTIQHLAQLSLLAPDFLEARGRFVGQAVKGLNGKVGREQLAAIATLAVAQAGSAFVLSKLSGDDWDPKHPFEVVHNGRRYSMRSVPEDIFSAMKDTRQFIYSRVSPLVVRGGIQLATGLNYRGEKVGAKETIGELLAGYVPIMARALPGLRDLTATGKNNPVSPLEQLAGSLGVRVSRYSPISETYRLAGDWMDSQKLPRDRGSYPISKYQKLRYSLEDGNMDEAKLAYDELKKEMKPNQITMGFKESVNHPFTGSKTSDAKFAATLKPYEKALYDQALKKRKDIWNNYTRLSK